MQSRRKKGPWLAGAIVALLLIGISDLAGAGDKSIASEHSTATPSLTTSADVRAVSALSRARVFTTRNPVSGPTVVRNADNGDEFTAALAKLETLPIKGRAPKTGYSRNVFGPTWSDDVNVEGGRNGCDTRNDILRRDLIDITVKPGSNDCTVLSGTLIDPYTGTTIPFTRGAKTSTAIEIDHVVALADAWQKGAQQLDLQTRQDFANDPRNLQATAGAINRQKGDGDAATWLPPNKAYRCTYVSRQVEVKTLYGLWVTQAEHDAIANLLTGCGAIAPSPAAAPAPPAGNEPAAALQPEAVAPTAGPAPVEPTTPVPTPGPGRIVPRGAFCSPGGATGVSSKGEPMICSPDKNGKNRRTPR